MNEEYPTTDTDEIKARLSKIEEAQTALNTRLDAQATGINAIGANMQWLVENVQGIFQMFASPAFMSQMTNALMGGLNGGKQGPDTGPDSGADSGGTGDAILGEVERNA